MSLFIRKASGGQESFDEKKMRESFVRAGAGPRLAAEASRVVLAHLPARATTEDVYQHALGHFIKTNPSVAVKYSLKRAIMNLGPAGHVFERYIGRIFHEYGYETQISQMVQGRCVMHEVDVLARKGSLHYMIECKYHNQLGIRSDIKVALYTQSRFLDIRDVWDRAEHDTDIHRGWLVTNTKPTREAIQYASCVGLRIIAWRYPRRWGLDYFIEKKHLYPITILPSLPHEMLDRMSQEGVLLVSDIVRYTPRDLTERFSMDMTRAAKLYTEAKQIL